MKIKFSQLFLFLSKLEIMTSVVICPGIVLVFSYENPVSWNPGQKYSKTACVLEFFPEQFLQFLMHLYRLRTRFYQIFSVSTTKNHQNLFIFEHSKELGPRYMLIIILAQKISPKIDCFKCLFSNY